MSNPYASKPYLPSSHLFTTRSIITSMMLLNRNGPSTLPWIAPFPTDTGFDLPTCGSIKDACTPMLSFANAPIVWILSPLSFSSSISCSCEMESKAVYTSWDPISKQVSLLVKPQVILLGNATLYGYFTLRGPLSDSATFFLGKLSILPVKFYKWEIRVACLSKAYTNH